MAAHVIMSYSPVFNLAVGLALTDCCKVKGHLVHAGGVVYCELFIVPP